MWNLTQHRNDRTQCLVRTGDKLIKTVKQVLGVDVCVCVCVSDTNLDYEDTFEL